MAHIKWQGLMSAINYNIHFNVGSACNTSHYDKSYIYQIDDICLVALWFVECSRAMKEIHNI